MSGSDGEWYLRRCAEDEVLAGERSVLGDRADALIAVDLIAADTAARILDLYRRARALRGRGEDDWAQGTPTVSAVMPPPPRINACGRTSQQPWGEVTVHYLASNTQQTTVSVTIRSSANPTGPLGGTAGFAGLGGHAHLGGPPSVTATDDRGRRYQTQYAGGGTGHDWQGSYVISPPLPADTKWVRIFGQRIELTGSPSDVTVTVEVLDQDYSMQARAERHLIRLAESGGGLHRGTNPFPVAVETLVDCGALSGAAPMIRQAAMFSDALQGASVPAAQLPQQWQSVIAGRGRQGGPLGSRTVGVTTPVFDEIRVSVLALRSRADDVEIDFEATGNLGRTSASWPAAPVLTVTAVDDRRQHYLGMCRQFGYRGGTTSGTIAFGAPLDPSAENLEIHFTMETARAVVRVPLQWDGTA